jgi:50S ribosomal protein L16 3-hydroxylase
VLRHLGALSIEAFLRTYWQRHPVLIRQAFALDRPPLDRHALFALAASEDVESRRITHFDQRWQLAHGPFARLPPVRRAHWTVLVQAVDSHDPAAAALLRRFRFLPDARLDDLMVSYATDGGGVGPHVDSYDVFLVQAQGRRRWRIGSAADPQDVIDGLPLRVLREFHPRHDWVLEPGDVLYLPPGVPHDGTAAGECITCSVGFRAPAWAELVEPWQETLVRHHAPAGRYADPGARSTRSPARLPVALIDAAHAALNRHRPTRADTELALLARSSEPRQHIVFDPPHAALGATRFAVRAQRAGLATTLKTRLLYSRGYVGINGEAVALPAGAASRRALQRLADRRQIDAAHLQELSAETWQLLHAWYRAGWIEFCNTK